MPRRTREAKQTPDAGEPRAAVMGNKIARTTQASATEYYLHDLPSTYNLVLLDVVSRGRCLKSVRCKHDEGLLLVKVYFKRAGEPIDLKVTAATGLSPGAPRESLRIWSPDRAMRSR